MFITISITTSLCRTCLVLSVVVPVHFICFTVGEWEKFFSIPLYVLTCKVIDNKATLTLTLTLTLTHTHAHTYTHTHSHIDTHRQTHTHTHSNTHTHTHTHTHTDTQQIAS